MRFAQTAGVGAILLLLGCSDAALPVAPEPKPAQEAVVPQVDPLFEPRVRELVRRSGKRCGFDIVAPFQNELLQLGESAFPVYEVILADPKTDERMVFLTCKAIERVKVDRRRFIPLAMKRLTAEDAMYVEEERYSGSVETDPARRARQLANDQGWARRTAILLIGEIGDEREAAAIAPYLTNDEGCVRYAAATAIVKIGTHRELETLNACLKAGAPPRRDANEIQFLTERRDELAKRLKEHPVPKTLTN